MTIFDFEVSLRTISIGSFIFGALGLIINLSINRNNTNTRKKTNTVNASNGSVAAGGDISTPIQILNLQQKPDPQKSGLTIGVVWNIVCGIATLFGLIGLGVTLAPLLSSH
jgi:hypothetical protein